MKRTAYILSLVFVALLSTQSIKKEFVVAGNSEPAITEASASLPLDKIKLPKGFSIKVFAEVDNARSLAISPSGTIFVGNKDEDKVYAIKDTNGDGVADKKWVIAKGLNMPNGVAFRNGDLYVAEISRIHKFSNIESKLDNPGKSEIIYDKYPTDAHHGWKYIAFGPDGKLYVPVGAPCNICESKNPVYASITRMNPDGTGMEVFANGIRNSVGFTWHPKSKDMWFTDNGRDMLGDDMPPCELNKATKAGLHFGYPYCHGGFIKDEEFGNKRPCSDFVKPAQNLGAHVAPLGLKFYTGQMFPAEYQNNIIVAEHGSWNRTRKSGYKLSLVKVDASGNSTSYTPFATGWLDEAAQKAWGRPVDVLLLPDGSMLVSDDQANVIYRITYAG
ncbi:MAG TPA: sorbosone dehydrogenase [Cytophagales bacterium]|jgi:glucose/arabinose dehydrogenase|nr:sorbosone dehydrogenase [Cytophagales bacterium]